MDHLSLPKEFDYIVDIRVIRQPKDIIIGHSGFLLCCNRVNTTISKTENSGNRERLLCRKPLCCPSVSMRLFVYNKAKNIIGCCKKLISDFGGQVPKSMEELTSLPGVGRKTANIIIGDIYKKPAIVVDTHAKRIAKRIGLTKNTDPTKVEFDLAKILPEDYTFEFCHQLVYHGRAICKSQKPACADCPIRHICEQNI